MRQLVNLTIIILIGCWSSVSKSALAFDETQLAVWANEAIIATYSYDDKNFMPKQQQIAKYFSGQGWINYTKAFNASGLPKLIQTKHYRVTAVATMPPVIKTVAAQKWQATMPVLVVYTNPQQQQVQHLLVSINFEAAQKDEGMRGLAVTQFKSKTTSPLCDCPLTSNEPPK